MHDREQDEHEESGMLKPPSDFMRAAEYEQVRKNAPLRYAGSTLFRHNPALTVRATLAQILDRACRPTTQGGACSRRACLLVEGADGCEARPHVHKERG